MPMGRVLVVGGGIAGIATAINLARSGVAVTLVEREAHLGGNALTVCCKAIDGVCQLCGGCLLRDRIAEVQSLANVQIKTGVSVDRVSRPATAGDAPSLHVRLTDGSELSASAVVLATGFDHVDARSKGPYGLGILPAVTTGEEMERRLSQEGQWAYDADAPKRVAFVQCVGSRDERAGRGYCSQVCCRYALRLARLLKARIPGVEITIHKMDLQTSGRDICPTWKAARQEGLRVIAGLPAVIRRPIDDPTAATFFYDDILGATMTEATYDLVVLSTGIQPRADAALWAETFGLDRDAYGFYATLSDGSSTLAPGVFAVGCCAAPRSIAESVAHAGVAAEACLAWLRTNAPAPQIEPVLQESES